MKKNSKSAPMTKEAMVARMSAILPELDKNVGIFNGYLAKKEPTKEDIAAAADAEDNIEKLLEEYNGMARNIFYEQCKETTDPMLTAVTLLEYPCKAVKDVRVDGIDYPVKEVKNISRRVNLVGLHSYCGGIGGIGHSEDWHGKIQKFGYHMTFRIAKDLGGEKAVKALAEKINSTHAYGMSRIAAQVNFGKDPVSNTKMLKTLQECVTAMIGEEYKVTSHDVSYIVNAFTKAGNASRTISCANDKNLVGYMAQMCNRIVTKAEYSIEQRQIRERKENANPAVIADASAPAAKVAPEEAAPVAPATPVAAE